MEKRPTAPGPSGPDRLLEAALFADGDEATEGAASLTMPPYRLQHGDERLTAESLTALLERVDSASVYLRKVEADAQEWEHIVEQVHARMYARIVEVEEQVRSAEARARQERARAELAEERLHSLEQLVLTIAGAMDDFDDGASR